MAELTDRHPRDRPRALRRRRRATAAAAEAARLLRQPGRRSRRAGEQVFGAALYDGDEADGAPDAAVAASLGCGVPTAVADLHEGETVLDLGSGAGADVLISRPPRRARPARRSGST